MIKLIEPYLVVVCKTGISVEKRINNKDEWKSILSINFYEFRTKMIYVKFTLKTWMKEMFG